jgi:hypothetical protein
MTDESPLQRMQRIADYRTTCKFLVKSGKQGIIFGSLFLFVGIMSFDNRITDYLYLGLGSIELFVGLHNRFRPSAFGIILDGIMLILLGAWNLASMGIIINQGVPPSLFSAIFGVVVILVAITRFRRYPRIRAAFEDPPTAEQIAWLDEVIKEIQDSTAASEDTVEFRAGLLWKGKRYGDTVIFVDIMDSENLIVDRRDIGWQDKGKALFSSRRNVSLNIGERSFAIAEFAPEVLDRLELWRTEGEAQDLSTHDEGMVPE